jgi:acetone carboxylase gamma subunit
MDIKQIYREENEIEPYSKFPNHEDHFNNKYVKWLEDKINLQEQVEILPKILCEHPFKKIRHINGKMWGCECGHNFEY